MGPQTGSGVGEADDPFGTEDIRARVLAGWAAAPVRFREDANAEEDYALGGYRDRLIVELAQNAADAALAQGVRGRLLVRLTDHVLVVANTGGPIDSSGVESLSTLRASAKRTGRSVGRFGVGFAAVLAVTDEPAIGSVTRGRTVGVSWSRKETLRLITAMPALAGELAAREDHVPVLRLPFPAAVEVPDGYDTAVVLRLRDERAASLALELVRAIDAALLLALPALDQIVVDAGPRQRVLNVERDTTAVTVDDDGRRTEWRVATSSGKVPLRLMADRPVEERVRSSWQVTWALPAGPAGWRAGGLPSAIPAVLHAPTPTDEQLPWPALLIASFPLDPSRRRVAPGGLADALLERCAEAYVDLIRGLAESDPTPSLLALVPGQAAVGEFDARLRGEVLRRLPNVAFMPAAADPDVRLSPRAAVIVEGARDELVSALTPVLPGLLPTAWGRHALALSALGTREIRLADLVDELATTRREPAEWRGLYDALSGADPEALGALPVPLADGRTVRGPRGLLIPTGGTGVGGIGVLGLRVVHPQATHPLLERLGARRVDARAVLEDPLVRVALDSVWDLGWDPDGRRIVEAALGLVRDADLRPGELPWLSELPLLDEDGELAAAGELMLRGGELAGLVEHGSLGLVHESLEERWGARVLEGAGVLRTFALVRDTDVIADPHAADHDLDDEDGWLAWLLDQLPERATSRPPVIAELVAVRDLEVVRADAWPAALTILAQPPLRDAVVQPAHLVGAHLARLPSYTAWWLRRHARLDGRRTTELRTADDDRLAGLYDSVLSEGDPSFLHALGVRRTLPELLAEPGGPQQLVDRLGDPALPVGRGQLRALLRDLASVDPRDVAVPSHVRVPDRAGTRVVTADEAVVLDAPDLLPLVGGAPVVTVPSGCAAALAEVLGLELASEVFEAKVQSEGVRRPVPADAAGLISGSPAEWVEHSKLVVDGVEVEWRAVGGDVHAATTWGLACGLAWAAGRWPARHLLAAALGDPELLESTWSEADLDPFEP